MMPDLMEEDCDSNEALMLCEYCHGPITKMKKFGKSGQQFCSKQCAESQTRNEVNFFHFVNVATLARKQAVFIC